MDEIKPNPAAERERERFISSHDIGCIFSYSKVIWLFVYNSCVLQQWDTKNKPWGCHPPCLIKLMMVKACDKLVELSNVSISVKICEDLLRSVKICQDLSRSIRVCEDLERSAKICQDLPRSVKTIPRSIGVCEDLERSAKICQDLERSDKICWDLSKYAMTNYMILKSHSPFVLWLMPQKRNGWWKWRCLSLHRYIATSLQLPKECTLEKVTPRHIATSLHRYIATSLHCYMATSLHRYSAISLQLPKECTLEKSTPSLHRYIATLLQIYLEIYRAPVPSNNIRGWECLAIVIIRQKCDIPAGSRYP